MLPSVRPFGAAFFAAGPYGSSRTGTTSPHPASEKLEIISIVEQSHLSARKTLDKLEDAVPVTKTLWPHREVLTKAGAVKELFNQFDGYLKAELYLDSLLR